MYITYPPINEVLTKRHNMLPHPHDPHILTLLIFKHIGVRRGGGVTGIHDDVLVIVWPKQVVIADKLKHDRVPTFHGGEESIRVLLCAHGVVVEEDIHHFTIVEVGGRKLEEVKGQRVLGSTLALFTGFCCCLILSSVQNVRWRGMVGSLSSMNDLALFPSLPIL